jgi:hypothetical protein
MHTNTDGSRFVVRSSEQKQDVWELTGNKMEPTDLREKLNYRKSCIAIQTV